jgi:hypothetical protein
VGLSRHHPRGLPLSGFDVGYEGMMNSSIDGGGLEFRGTEATLKIDRNGFAVYRESVENGQNPVLTEHSFRDGRKLACLGFGSGRSRVGRGSGGLGARIEHERPLYQR